MRRLKAFIARRWLLLSVLGLLVISPVFAVVEVRASRVRTELETDVTFVERARAAAQELGEPGREGLHCDAPLVSKQAGQALFGVSRAVAFVVAPPGQRLVWPGAPTEMIVGPGGCVRRVAALEAMRAYTGLGRQLKEAAHTPWRQLDRLLEVGELPVCMGSRSTDFGVVLVPRLADDGQGLAGRVDVRVIDFLSGEVRCEGSADVRLPPSTGSELDQERALAREYGALVERLLGAAQGAGSVR